MPHKNFTFMSAGLMFSERVRVGAGRRPDAATCLKGLWDNRTNLGAMQVYKAVRGGVQDVAVKIMHQADDEQLAQFEKVTTHF